MRNGELQKQKTSSVASAQEEFEVTLHVGHQYVVRTTTLAEVKVFDGDAAADHTVEQVLHELLRENRLKQHVSAGVMHDRKSLVELAVVAQFRIPRYLSGYCPVRVCCMLWFDANKLTISLGFLHSYGQSSRQVASFASSAPYAYNFFRSDLQNFTSLNTLQINQLCLKIETLKKCLENQMSMFF